MDGCTVKQKFASDSKTMTSLGTKAHLKNTKHCVLITVLIRHQKSKGEKALKLSIINLTIHPKW